MTYALLAIVFLAAGLGLALAASLRATTGRAWWSAVFDTAMIAADLFRYNDAALLGARVMRVPVEDFAWPVFAVLALPSLWALLGLVRTGEHGER
jgi:lycopene cyclase domain-containing protein